MHFIKKISFHISFFLLMLHINIAGQSNSIISSDLKFVKIGVEEGLSQSTVLSILQDKRGYLWFGTGNGLNRYDGYEFVVYNNLTDVTTSISDNEITSLFEDENGNLWIGTSKGILNKFNYKTETFEHFDIANTSDWYLLDEEKFVNVPLTLSRNQLSSITSIDQDKIGNLWIGTWGKGLIKFNPKTHQKKYFYHFKNKISSLSSNKIVKVFIDSENIIWIGTFGGGINKITVKNDSLIKIYNKNIYPFNILRIGDKITWINEDKDQNLIISEYNYGIVKVERSTKKLNPNHWKISPIDLGLNEKSYPLSIMTFQGDESENLWIGTYGHGLIKYNSTTKTSNQYLAGKDKNSLSENEIQSIYLDKSGIVWIGTQLGKGINKVELSKNNFMTIPVLSVPNKSLNDNIIWTIFESTKNDIWIGTYRGGINKINYRTNVFEYYGKDKIGDSHIRTIIEDFKGNMWIGTFSNGLTFYDVNRNIFKHFTLSENIKSLKSNQIQALAIDGDSILYIGTFGGGLSKLNLINFYKDQIPEFTTYKHSPSNNHSISDDRIYSLHIDKNGELWIGTHGSGLNLFDKKSLTFSGYKNENNLLNDNGIMTITESVDNKLLIGTFGGGLILFDPKTKIYTNINKSLKLDCNDVYGIIDDNKSGYWLSTNNGIYKIEYDLKSFVRYGLLDGLQSLEFSGGAYFKSKSGIIYFGGINGVNYFNPNDIKIDKFDAPVVITKIKLFDKIIKGEKKELIFTRDQNYFSFEFASLDYKKSGKNNYKYMLEGLEKKWNYTSAENRKVYYTNLAPGDYKFIVTGTNNDGVWSSKFASIDIKILAPFWMQWWFISLLILLIGGIIVFFINQRIKYLIAMDKLKTNLSADLHDNVGAGLTEISILSELTATEVSEESNVSKNLTKISDLSRQLVESMSDIVWVVNPNRDSLYELIVRLKDSYSELFFEMGITLQTSDLEKLVNIKIPMDVRQNLYLILKESINNAVKHSSCKTITLDIAQINKKMKIEITDDGSGFKLNQIRNGNGLYNMKQRADKINWKIRTDSEIGLGTKVTLEGKI